MVITVQHNNGNYSISSNNIHENNSNSMIINDPVCCSLVHFENDLEKLEEKSNTIKQSKVSEEPEITNTKCSIDKEILQEANKNPKSLFNWPCYVRISKLPDEVIHNVLKRTSSSKLKTTTVDSSIYSLPATSTKQPSKLKQMSSRPGRSNTSAPSSLLNVFFKKIF
jgi:hypothetical protein